MMRCVFAAFLALSALPAIAGLATSKHNLSVSGPGTVKSSSEAQICIFCHAPHNASPIAPLWNRSNPGATYTPYTSSTSVARPGQPTGASLYCLSCHDGTVALGDVLSRSTRIGMAGGISSLPAGKSNLGTDLSGDHPISFAYNAGLASMHNGELANPATLTGKVKLDASGQLQCTSCHDPHDDTNGKFLVVPNQASALCQICHTPNYWGASNHKLSGKTWNGAGTNPWPHTGATTVAGNACENCHRPHTAGGKQRLLNNAAEEDNCYSCHNGNVAAKNIQSEFTGKSSIHPVAASTGIHDPAEPALITSRHVECVDCHNPHAANASSGLLPGSLAGVLGINTSGTGVKPATAEYQICFRCHADSPNQPGQRTIRQIAQINTRLEFATSNPSFHPVSGPGMNANVPSLIAPWTTASTMTCGDCHNNNTGPGAGGNGPNGPHGSVYPTLLERQYLKADRTPESAANYALCYKCHNRTNILGDRSFKEHSKHIIDERTPCNACHDPHGISSTQGNAINNSKLINFDTTISRPSSSGQLKYVSNGTNRGSCYLTCHGKNHNPLSY
ncbi:MAG: cytochrome c3 family protein [Proteobacteria bacterium]|nr:cytochrome c3 family protein [Pseudomonadota bacterium]